jgi:hypothetical protein
MNDIVKATSTALVNPEAERIARATQGDAGFEALLKFKKGHYWLDNSEIPLDSEYIAYAIGFTKQWICWENSKPIERHTYRMSEGKIVPEREDLDRQDQSKWEEGLDGRPADPWQLNFILPLENPTTGDLVVFSSSSFGGKRAIGELCNSWARRASRQVLGQPIVKLQVKDMPTKKYGPIPRPHFEVVGYVSEPGAAPVRNLDAVQTIEDKKREFDDEIPFDLGAAA